MVISNVHDHFWGIFDGSFNVTDAIIQARLIFKIICGIGAATRNQENDIDRNSGNNCQSSSRGYNDPGVNQDR
jgi:hypothetical protein